MACGIFLDQIKLMSLHLQVDSNHWTVREALSNILSNIREELILIILKFFQNITEGVTLPSYFYKATITLISKLIYLKKKKENYRPISLTNTDAKILKNKTKTPTSTYTPITY